MKKVIAFLFAVLTFSASGLQATEPEAAVNLLSKKYAFKDFQNLSVSNSFEVTLVQDEKWFVEVEYSDFLQDYLEVSVSSGTLRLGLKNIPRALQLRRKRNERVLKATVHMPRLERLSMSGATKLFLDGHFSLPDGLFQLDMSGASKLENMSVDAQKARLVLSGAATCNSFEGSFSKVTMKTSGASKCRVNAAALDWDLTLSGASDIVLSGPACQTLDVESSGASKAEVSIPSALLEYEGSGSSSLTALDAPTGKAKIEISGASTCRIAVRESLEVEATGASVCRYKAVDGAPLKTQLDCSRGARIISL